MKRLAAGLLAVKEEHTMHAAIDDYITCALWSSSNIPPEGEEFESLDQYELADGVREELAADLIAFVSDPDLAADLEGLDPGQVAHDFWLTRNGHGAGFWDRGLGERGERLTAACRPYGSVDLYIGDDGLVYSS